MAIAVGGQPDPLDAVDPEGEPLTYAVTDGSLPEGLVLNGDGTWTGGAETPGSYAVSISVCDPANACDGAVLSITVTGKTLPSTNLVPVAGTPLGASTVILIGFALVVLAEVMWIGTATTPDQRRTGARCGQLTLRGVRCRRAANHMDVSPDGAVYCWQHGELPPRG